ncbi:MAG TPA: tetratricopeptide repeat protein [Candidatus Dormibacteraeota bacterium]|nr:tetratricopeptide repeat protein [Candidatus Dormibacteraeota bacterium]
MIGAARGFAESRESPGPAAPAQPTTAVPRRVFLSHTSDLGEPDEKGTFVAAAVAAILRARHAVTDMACFAARDTWPAAVCAAMVGQSDVYVGIIGVRHGSPVRDRPDVSYTELEFDAAGEHGQPRLVFLVREESEHLATPDEQAGRRARHDAFRRRLLDSGLTVVQVGSPGELEIAIYQALVELGPTPDAPARLAEGQALLASMPTDVPPDRAPLPAGSRMPLAPNPLFVGRCDELLQIAAALRGGDTTVAIGQVVASTGLGGLGKTQLAVELVHRYGRFFAGGVFWLSFASADEIPLQVAACAGPDFETRSLEERVQRVKDAWQSAIPRLLVFDNCEEEALLESWRPPSGGCRVLVTSRRSHWSPTLGVTNLPLGMFPRPDSVALLRRYRPDQPTDEPGLDAIAHELGDLPLALHLAGSYLRAYRADVGLDGYLADLRRSDVVQHASLLGAGLADSVSPTHHVQGVAQTFALCLGRLDRERAVDRVAIALLARMACLAPGEAAPRDLLGRALEEVAPRRRADGLRRLGAVGLVEEGEGWLRLHRLLVHFVRHGRLDPTARPAVARALIGCGEDARHGRLTGAALAALIPHLFDVAAEASSSGDDRLAAELCTAVGRVLRGAGDRTAARPWYERALGIRERVLGPDHLDTADALNDLGEVLYDHGVLAAARPLFERALAIREKVLGPDDPRTALSVHNLGTLLRALGELAAARPLLERAVEIHERVLEPDHPSTALSLNGLGVLLVCQGDLAAARPFLERALAIRERVSGPGHPDTATSLTNLGMLLRHGGELAAAERLLGRALDIRERVLGLDHPDTAMSRNGLGFPAPSPGQAGRRQAPPGARPGHQREGSGARSPVHRLQPQRPGCPAPGPGRAGCRQAPPGARPGHPGAGAGARLPRHGPHAQ